MSEKNYHDVPKEELRTGVTFKRVYGVRTPEKKGKAPNVNKFAHLVDPDTNRGLPQKWV